MALRILGVKPKVGEIGVTLKVPLCTPLITIEEHDLTYCCFRTFSRVVSHKKREEQEERINVIIIINDYNNIIILFAFTLLCERRRATKS